MLDKLKAQPADKIIALMQQYRDDPRTEKVDLGVGVYKTAEGLTPIMRAVKKAEQRIWESQDTKTYTALSGDPIFSKALVPMILGDSVDPARIASAATPGGTGAIRQGFEAARLAAPGCTVWVSNPTWANHVTILKFMGLPMKEYRYFDEASRSVDFDGMKADLAKVSAGDVVLLHGCCHNPTGANLSADQWQTVTEILLERRALPFVDIAYQGFGDGLDADAAGLRLMAGQVPEMLIASSCSKNFGIYRERTGLLLAISRDPSLTAVAQGNLNHINRQTYSFPPDHGARIVGTILADPDLRREWEAELEEVRLHMLDIRQKLADELKRRTNSDRFEFITRHRGMFSRLGATPEQVQAMRDSHGIYMVGDSRINIAGLNDRTIPILAEAMLAAGL